MNNWRLLLLALVAVFQPSTSFTDRHLVDGRQQCCDRRTDTLLRDSRSSLHGTDRLVKSTPPIRRFNTIDETPTPARFRQLKHRTAISSRTEGDIRRSFLNIPGSNRGEYPSVQFNDDVGTSKAHSCSALFRYDIRYTLSNNENCENPTTQRPRSNYFENTELIPNRVPTDTIRGKRESIDRVDVSRTSRRLLEQERGTFRRERATRDNERRYVDSKNERRDQERHDERRRTHSQNFRQEQRVRDVQVRELLKHKRLMTEGTKTREDLRENIDRTVTDRYTHMSRRDMRESRSMPMDRKGIRVSSINSKTMESYRDTRYNKREIVENLDDQFAKERRILSRAQRTIPVRENTDMRDSRLMNDRETRHRNMENRRETSHNEQFIRERHMDFETSRIMTQRDNRDIRDSRLKNDRDTRYSNIVNRLATRYTDTRSVDENDNQFTREHRIVFRASRAVLARDNRDMRISRLMNDRNTQYRNSKNRQETRQVEKRSTENLDDAYSRERRIDFRARTVLQRNNKDMRDSRLMNNRNIRSRNIDDNRDIRHSDMLSIEKRTDLFDSERRMVSRALRTMPEQGNRNMQESRLLHDKNMLNRNIESRRNIRHQERRSIEHREDQSVRENRMDSKTSRIMLGINNRDMRYSRLMNDRNTGNRNTENRRDTRHRERVSKENFDDGIVRERDFNSRISRTVLDRDNRSTRDSKLINDRNIRYNEHRRDSRFSDPQSIDKRMDTRAPRTTYEGDNKELRESRLINARFDNRRDNSQDATLSKVESESEVFANWQYIVYTLQIAYLCGLAMQMMATSHSFKPKPYLSGWLPSTKLIKVE